MIRLLLVLGLIDGLAEGLSPNRRSTNATTGSGANAGQTPDEYCQSLCGSPPSSICGDKGSYCKPYGPPQNGVGVCQGFYYLPNNRMCYFGPLTTSTPYPTGFFSGSGTVAGATFNISALFSDTTTVLEDMNVTVPGIPPIQIEQLPYTMIGTRLNITDFSKVPSEFRQFIKTEIDYYSGNQTIVFSIPGVVSVKLTHPHSSRRLKR
ncbi:hypothetical protein FOL46_009759 [Perkinsus olseni]|uniref:Uncharacterized protein n=1 Tax=Perkinsus olseni TaxID=32597 RepID=A0A7J6KYZ5_PEROL|nr:hypothetical protein FOL46_009759 [Perkinsus olseni]